MRRIARALALLLLSSHALACDDASFAGRGKDETSDEAEDASPQGASQEKENDTSADQEGVVGEANDLGSNTEPSEAIVPAASSTSTEQQGEGALPGGGGKTCNSFARVGGFCWHLSELGEDCNQACEAHGGYDEATATFAGSSGTWGHCHEVLDALKVGSVTGPKITMDYDGTGCAYKPMLNMREMDDETPTNATAKVFYLRRACACAS